MRLRHIEEDDLEWLLELHNDPEVLRNLTHPQPITMLQHRDWWDSIKGNSKQDRLVFVAGETRIGLTKFYDIDRHNKCCMLGADIHSDNRGKGFAKPMWSLMLDRCFGDLGLHRVSLTTAEYNAIGQRVYRGLGFAEEGRQVQSLFRDGRFYDMVCMYMLREQWTLASNET